MSWRPINEDTPRGVIIETKIDDENGERNVQELKLGTSNNLWWLVDGSMYVYYTPTHWRPAAFVRQFFNSGS